MQLLLQLHQYSYFPPGLGGCLWLRAPCKRQPGWAARAAHHCSSTGSTAWARSSSGGTTVMFLRCSILLKSLPVLLQKNNRRLKESWVTCVLIYLLLPSHLGKADLGHAEQLSPVYKAMKSSAAQSLWRQLQHDGLIQRELTSSASNIPCPLVSFILFYCFWKSEVF